MVNLCLLKCKYVYLKWSIYVDQLHMYFYFQNLGIYVFPSLYIGYQQL